MKNLSFTPFEQREHINLLKKWLQGEHVQGFWRELAKEDDVADEFLSQLRKRGVHSYLAVLGGDPIGYIQYYEVGHESEAWANKKPEKVYEIELLIGETEQLKKGLAQKIIQGFITFMQNKVDFTNIIVDSRSSNAKALKAFKSVGYEEVMRLTLNENETVLLKLSQ